jgi:hypothetical protein
MRERQESNFITAHMSHNPEIPLPLVCLSNQLLQLERVPSYANRFPYLKDPSITRLADGRFRLYCSIGDSRIEQWQVGVFESESLLGPWREMNPVQFTNISGPELCAPAVLGNEAYIQSGCFREDTVIHRAQSLDGYTFTADHEPVVTKDSLAKDLSPIVGVYDAGTSILNFANKTLLMLYFTGFAQIRHGAIYATCKDISTNSRFIPARKVMDPQDIPFHDWENPEWSPEGFNVAQIGDIFVSIGVGFRKTSLYKFGTRQRFFLGASYSPFGPFKYLGIPFLPVSDLGEHGHGEFVIEGNTFHIFYQERLEDGQPWHLRHAQFDLGSLHSYARGELSQLTQDFTPQSLPLELSDYPHTPPEA